MAFLHSQKFLLHSLSSVAYNYLKKTESYSGL
jgi:hypothetical protein